MAKKKSGSGGFVLSAVIAGAVIAGASHGHLHGITAHLTSIGGPSATRAIAYAESKGRPALLLGWDRAVVLRLLGARDAGVWAALLGAHVAGAVGQPAAHLRPAAWCARLRPGLGWILVVTRSCGHSDRWRPGRPGLCDRHSYRDLVARRLRQWCGRDRRLRAAGGCVMAKKKSGGGFILSAVAVGVLASASHGHLHVHIPATLTSITSGGCGGVSGNAATGCRMAAAAGWTGGQWQCLNWLWTRESGWQMVWNRQGSGAYGIPQSLPASKMASAGADYMTDPVTQIRWGLGYIRSTYQTPCGAWAHETQFGWY